MPCSSPVPATDPPPNAPADLPPPLRVLLRIALPTIAALASRTVMSFADFLMVSRLGVDEQAAIVPATVVVFAVVSFGMGGMTAVSTLASQAFGRGDRADAGAWAWQGVWASLAFALAALAFWPFAGPLFAAAGHTPEVEALETGYVQIALLGVFPTVVAMAVSNFFTAVQRPAVTFWATVVANALNIGGNWVLIYGNLGAPALGMDGAAWATTAAAFLQAAILAGWMLRPRMRAAFATWPAPGPSRPRLRRMVKLGVPAGLQSGLEFLVFGFFIVGLVSGLGTVPAAASNIAFKFSEIAFMPCIGIGIAVTAVVGESLGAGDRGRARRAAAVAMRIAAAWVGFCGLLAFTAGPWIVGGVAADAEVAALGIVLLWIGVSFQWSDAVQFIYLGALRGAGDNRFPAVFTAFSATIVLLGGGWLATVLFDAYAVHMAWVALSAYVAAQAVAFWWRWRRGAWERIEA
ncbi:MATE family efflux transporter [Phycisphaera mikurensis]|uniref:MATE family efflux transporter n=1 Tax=Phycisphaera mikurensis TaxID=547188 RepID=UPI001461428B|nr:MATE family efflux transporter [Phycisphaera mikurensis]MBB6442648.1 MATE family multidrug resistance protein [Phycisphaera mikurensis]